MPREAPVVGLHDGRHAAADRAARHLRAAHEALQLRHAREHEQIGEQDKEDDDELQRRAGEDECGEADHRQLERDAHHLPPEDLRPVPAVQEG